MPRITPRHSAVAGWSFFRLMSACSHESVAWTIARARRLRQEECRYVLPVRQLVLPIVLVAFPSITVFVPLLLLGLWELVTRGTSSLPVSLWVFSAFIVAATSVFTLCLWPTAAEISTGQDMDQPHGAITVRIRVGFWSRTYRSVPRSQFFAEVMSIDPSSKHIVPYRSPELDEHDHSELPCVVLRIDDDVVPIAIDDTLEALLHRTSPLATVLGLDNIFADSVTTVAKRPRAPTAASSPGS